MSDGNKSVQTSLGELKATVDYLREDLVMLRESQDIMNKTLAVNTAQLELHIEGVKLAREQNELLKKDVDTRFETLNVSMNNKFSPVQKHINNVSFLAKVGLALISTPAAIYYVIKIVQLLTGKG
jgi:hypothetical protein